jgi:hypothetical protein
MDNKIAFTLIRLVQILLWIDLENVITHLEAHWFDLVDDLFARLLDVAERLISLAIQVRESSGPLLPNLLKDIWRN